MTFLTPIDIANRALQHCGVDLIDPTLGFTEPSDRAMQCGFAYDKVRRFELRRNTWQFAIKRAVIRPLVIDPTEQSLVTMQILPQIWSSSTTYFMGNIVQDAAGAYWVSLIHDNLGNSPGLTPSAWEAYYGPSCATPFDTTGQTTYFAGDVVYLNFVGFLGAYISKVNSNTVSPVTTDVWSATTNYNKDDVVSLSSVFYQSLEDANQGNQPTPGNAPFVWVATTTYAIGNQVVGSEGDIYTSNTNGNVGNDPHLDIHSVNWTNDGPGFWTQTITTNDVGANEWAFLTTNLQELPTSFQPVGMAVNINGPQRSVYPLPYNFLRLCAQDPKQGSVSFLGAPSGNQYLDWIFDGKFLVSRTQTPIVLRFVADVTDVRAFDDMFCEGLAARLAYEVCPKLTQSISKRQDIAKAYQTFMNEARIVNGIEEQPTEPPEDDYITCRL